MRIPLVLGASGLIGRRLMSEFGPQNAVGTFEKKKYPGGARFSASKDSIDRILDAYPKIGTAYLLLAESRIDVCAREYARASAINVTAMKSIIDALFARQILPVFYSSDMVFDGRGGPYNEESKAVPIVTYGQMKLEIENYLKEKKIPHLTIRLSKVISSDIGINSLLTEWRDAVRSNNLILCAEDQAFCPIDLEDVVQGSLELVGQEARGTFHLAGPAGVLRSQLFRRWVSQNLRYDASFSPRVEFCKLNEIPGFEEARPIDSRLDISKMIQETNFRPRDWQSVVDGFTRACYSK